MKRGFCLILTTVRLFLLGATAAYAEYPPYVEYTDAVYAGGNSSTFAAVGEVYVPYSENAPFIIDGDLPDWAAEEEVAFRDITLNNMLLWDGENADSSLSMAFAAFSDSEYLYLALDVVDPTFTYASSAETADGDTVRLKLDVCHLLRDAIEKDPDALINQCTITYSFSCAEDGAPMTLFLENGDQDGPLCEESKGENAEAVARRTEWGWSAELVLPWQMLVDHYVWKAWDENTLYYYDNVSSFVTVGCVIDYIDRSETGGPVESAFSVCAANEQDGVPHVSHTPFDEGMELKLTDEDAYVRADRLIKLSGDGGFAPRPPVVETTEAETEEPIEPPDETVPGVVYPPVTRPIETAPPEPDTTPDPPAEPDTREETETLDREEEIMEILDRYGCRNSAGWTVVAILLIATMALPVIIVLAIRKRD